MDHQGEEAMDLRLTQGVLFMEEAGHQEEEEEEEEDHQAAADPHGTAAVFLQVTRGTRGSHQAEAFHHHLHHPWVQARRP
jgi:hypothetical protein